MQYDFMKVGREICTDQDHIKRLYHALEWIECAKGITMPAGQGFAINQVIQDMKIPKVSHVSIHGTIDNLGFYGIRGHYKNGTVDICIADTGVEIIPVVCVIH